MPLDRAVTPATISTRFRKPEELLRRHDTAIPQLFEWHAKENPDYPLFVYHDGSKLEYITYSGANRAIDRAARFLASTVGASLHHKHARSSPPVVAIFANADTISYFCTYMGAMRAGYTVFLVSTRNGSAAVADMLQRTGAGHIIVSADDAMRATAEDALSTLSSAGAHVTQLAIPTFDALFAETLEPGNSFEAQVEFPTSFDMGAHATIMHSSGSTGHPKTIYWTHATVARWGRGPLGCDVNVEGSIFACHGSPIFHGLGTYVCCAAAWAGFVIGVFKPTFPPTLPIPDAVWEGLVAVNADFSWSVPSFIEEWARDPEKVLFMKKMHGGMMFGGAALNEEVGNVLARNGVSLFSEYGCTEAGMINAFARPNPGLEWEYWKAGAGVEVYFRPVEKDLCEVIILSPRDVPLAQTNTKIGDRDAYATSDLAMPHPTKPGFWKIVGRADEQIVLSNGEKTNPLPLEKMINDSPFVKSSVMFGRGKFQNGVLVEPAEEYVFYTTDVKQLEAFRNRIWQTIERVNEFAPQHSRIFKEMILVTSPSKPFEFTAKNQPRRNFILQQYHDEIEALYKAVESSAQGDLVPPSTWDPASTLVFVRAVVEGTLRRAIADDADIFRSGGDSLQATWIRNTILRAIRETDKAATARVPMNLVFAAPSIASLARVVHDIVHSESDAGASESRRGKPQDLWDYVAKYSADLPARPDTATLVERASGKDVVVITGTTGGFGCDTLEHLLNDERVGRVYAFNRKGTQAMERQRAQFRARGLDEALLNSSKFRMVEAVLHEPGFGLEAQLLEEIRTSVTHIMHNAWKVNFNMSIASFEVDIQGTRNFVDLALSSPYTRPPAIIFVSSVGTFANCTLPPPVPEVSMNDPAFAFGSGYSESKWVTEHMLENVSRQTGVHTVVMRLGQVAGDRLGYWNEKEWFPSLVKSALFQRCLPDIEGTVAWFPAYEAAKAFAEMRHSEEPFLHLVHPNPTTWHTLVAPIAQALGVPLVSYGEWLAALEKSVSAASGSSEEVETMKRNPALRILPFFKAQGGLMASRLGGEREPMGFVHLSTEKAAMVSEAFTKMPELDGERAMAWVAAWKKSGFLKNENL
ncbi:acetyl-CoA synthetase-like protein [Daedaleopsis nitida]|nr:acetyl-CoA synthetase-like protein [Daedaleopsis nitida]